ncbi:MAG: hypothetical protein JNL38_07690 [Myxococcales bacterium]|jgi:hypothetical protein|nr:hypothetical protein [Myxococcales bacterium]
MASWRRLAPFLCVPAILAATACVSTEPSEAQGGEDELNYRSTAGQEYSLSAPVTFKPSADALAKQGAERDAAIALEADALRARVASAISAELDKLWPEEQRISREGVAIQYRQGTASKSDLAPAADGRVSLTISAEFAAVKDIEKKLPLKTVDGKAFLPVSTDIGNGTEELQVTLTPIERSLNSYPKYMALFEDGLDIAVHVGGDHNDPPMDIAHARSIYDDLKASGFKSPVAKFEDLKIDSGPLTSAISVQGKSVPVRVRIVHVDMSTPETRQLLVDAYKESVKNADVVIYDGHAGRQLTYSGVVVAYKPSRVAIPASEFKNIEASDKQQVYLFNGCETYTGYADKLYENPKRNVDNTDVITTGNYSAIQSKANQVISFIHSMIDQRAGAWIPRSWDSVLARMNAVGERSWVHVYGVHGIDDNPRLSPLADAAKIGASCRVDADCGAADGRCVQVSSTRRVCGAACADTAGCPAGTKCVQPRGRTSIDDMMCLPN